MQYIQPDPSHLTKRPQVNGEDGFWQRESQPHNESHRGTINPKGDDSYVGHKTLADHQSVRSSETSSTNNSISSSH